MKSRILRRTQVARVAACAVLLNFSIAPGGAIAVYGTPLRESAVKRLEERAKAAKDLVARRAKSVSRLLSAAEERSLQGRAGENPYLAGQSKWDVLYNGVNLVTGNYSTSATDLSFDGGYGIPVNVTRSYSSNNGDAGPFGKGWTLSADVRSTAGGLVKSGSAPVRSVPVGFKERPVGETDPNAELATGGAAQPVEAVIATDAGGDQETVQKDVDGVLTTPPWDLNVNENTRYDFKTDANGQAYQVMTHNETVTPEGTRYVYDVQGYYSGGMVPWGSTGGTPTPANVMKITSATDRHGNVTTYTYSPTVYFDYTKSNGTTHEHPLTQVSMPGGHLIQFAWGTSGNVLGRVTSITDNPGSTTDERKVQYGYGPGGLLTSVTTPGGKTTNYGYGSAWRNVNHPWGSVGASDLLVSITDPRGLTSVIKYWMGPVWSVFSPTGYSKGVKAYKVIQPNGSFTLYQGWGYGSAEPGGSGNWGADDSIYNAFPEAERIFFRPYPDDIWGVGWMGRDFDKYGKVRHLELHNFIIYNGKLEDEKRNQDYANAYMNDVTKIYDPTTQNLISEERVSYDHADVTDWQENSSSLADGRKLFSVTYGRSLVTQYAYNFMGKPLTILQEEYNGSSSSASRSSAVSYAYWGADKYFQQKAVRTGEGDANYRYTFTDYYPNTDSNLGRRGQTYRVYDAKNGGVGLNTSATLPSYTPSVPTESRWRYQVQPTAGRHAAEFDYDPQGRPTDVWKLQKAPTNGAWTYVQTRTEYNGDWGQASRVIEDFGTGKINRTTQTLHYTPWGKANDVLDAAGRRFVTSFDKDGLLLGVTRMDNGNQPVVTYTYGGTAGTVENGQPLTVTDGLTQVSQSITYTQSGSGVGQPATLTETNGSDSYTTSYAYNVAGDRELATYATPNGTTRWGYYDYLSVGSFYAFQTMCLLDANGNRTSEEFHYAYDSLGRPTSVAFAQTPQVGGPTTRGYYDGRLASGRARTQYAYDSVGRVVDVSTYWDTLQNGSYGASPALIARNACGYELSATGSNPNRGLKTSSVFTMVNDAYSGYDSRTETYGYDPKNDNLTEAHYGDGPNYPSPDEAWSYDAVGNRSGNVVDNLNRATTAGGFACTSDVLGNQTSRTNSGGQTFFFNWDSLNRLTSHGRAGVWSANYGYRADGMRVSKLYNGITTRYRYDGQTAIEDVEQPASGNPTVTRYGLGARGVDYIERTSPSGAKTAGFPLYDAHGNMVATLLRNGSGGCSVGDKRRYSAWGSVRGGSPTGDPKGKYCASLGHRQDDESGLTYMRARYYDPTSGRFLSEDPAMQGSNWFAYCGNDPIGRADQTGRYSLEAVDFLFAALQDLLKSCEYGTFTNEPFTLEEAARRARRLEETAKRFARIATLEGEADIAEGEGLERLSAYGGSYAEIGIAAGKAREGIGGQNLAYGAAAKLASRMIEWVAEFIEGMN